MAKAKKSRRARRQEAERQRQKTDTTHVVETAELESVESIVEPSPEPEAVEEDSTSQIRRKVVDFSREYFYVYTDLRNIAIISVILFVIMVGLLYLI